MLWHYQTGHAWLELQANKCSDTGTEDIGVLPTHETLPCKCLLVNSISDAASTRPGRMLPQI